MDAITRRRFLVASGVAGGAALAAGSGFVTWENLQRRAATDPLPMGSRVIVLLTMYGGNDGLNTVIPYADPAYYDARPDLGYTAAEALHLDGSAGNDSLGLNPSMKGLLSMWQNKQLAIIRGVGYPKPDHSHFRSMDIWQTASPDTPVNTGWIGRWLDATGDDPIRAVNVGSVLAPLAVGAKASAAALAVGSGKALPTALASAVTGMAKADRADTAAQALLARSYSAERTVDATFSALTAAPTAAPTGDRSGGSAGLSSQLDLVARCIAAGVPTRVYAVSLGGFDTHASEKGSQQALLGELDIAVSNFMTTIAAGPRAGDVVLMAYSEFGRRVRANASQGTDHGTAGPVFVVGSPGGAVKGGFYGAQPSLTDLDNGDLKAGVDFRSIYAELLNRGLGADPEQILGGPRGELEFLQN
jgi:uncharacterized protein (DUF1501 family)